ncbi:hypothetical protein C2G38_2216528 [Gigaspora rosea]|uniref:Uncharacterized protein n=1 Tax=Gigaspora rosea TaxID=44941 RepID=A0A397UAE0_9GLOM|nr:hypothetical protein C2G38_2216528 [Gigaspora rosea]
MTMIYVEFLNDTLSNRFSAVKFFKHFQFKYTQKKHAEMCLFKALQTIALEKGVLAEKAQSILDIFDEYIRPSTEDSNILEEHINENDAILSKKRQYMNELNRTPQQKKKRSYSPTCSEEYSSSDSEIEPISLTDVFRIIDKLHVNGDEEVLKFLDNSSAPNDMIYVQNLFHFYFLYKNDVLLQSMSEHELNTHIWTPLLRNAFLEKTDIKLSYGELASRSYNKLKEMLNVAGNSAPKLDGKGLLRSLGTEILAQEDGVLNTYGKRTGDLKKLEYCTKILLTVLYFALPTTEKNDITEIETYSLQSNGFQLTNSASKYLFKNTIITVGLQDIEVPRTVEGLFQKF